MKNSIPLSVRNIIAKPIRSYINERVHRILRSTDHVFPIEETDPDDIFIVGYPKSGHTWFQNLVAGVVYGADPEHLPDRVVQDLIPDLHRKLYYKRYQKPMFFKSHNLPHPSCRRVIYILRDGRDVMVSYYHFLQAIHGKEIDFQELICNKNGYTHHKWHEHVEAWMQNPFDAQIIIIKYEDLKRDPVCELRRFCDFVGLSREDTWLEFVARKAQFETMQRKEQRYGWDNPKWPGDKFFVRRGAVGSHKDEMPPDVLDMFVRDAHGTLAKFGYL